MYGQLEGHLRQELAEIESAGLFKKERIIAGPQDAEIALTDGSKVLNFCANNYLGLSSHPRVVEAAKRAIDSHGFGMSSVRFICGTQDIHKELEQRIADFHPPQTTPSSTRQHSMQMAGFSSRCSRQKTPSSAIR